MAGGSEPAIDVSVVVPSRDRPLRLRWLLNALEEQTLSQACFEVIVAHDSVGSETEALLRSHPLAGAGVLRHVTLAPSTAMPAAKRNLGWRAARAPLIAFTDDDCRPPAGWLEGVLEAARRHPGAIVQGLTAVDPDESVYLREPLHRTQEVNPPTVWAEMCNLSYPRDVLERVDGLDETLSTFEDTDVSLRAQEQGIEFVAAPESVMFHAVHTPSLRSTLRGVTRWRDGPRALKRHPRLRRSLSMGVFRAPAHAWLPLAFCGVAMELRGRRFAALLSLPWALQAMPAYGQSPRGRIRALAELPVLAAVDAGEMVVLARNSLRHRSLLL